MSVKTKDPSICYVQGSREQSDTYPHHWILDENHQGVCKYCGSKFDFSPTKLLKEFCDTPVRKKFMAAHIE